MVYYEDKVYIPKYRGTYPLYLMGMQVGVTVSVTNKGPRKRTKLRIGTECYTLHTDGANGLPLADPQEYDVIIEHGETKVIDASFYAGVVPDEESGLDRFIVKLWRSDGDDDDDDDGDDDDDDQSQPFMTKEGIFCPPAYNGEAHSGGAAMTGD